jgi:hypothetical protein
MKTDRGDIRLTVDRLLATPKLPGGKGTWADDHREGDMRMLIPLVVDGEVSDLNLQIIAFPRSRTVQFRLLLLYGRVIVRLDYTHHEEHVNAFNRPADLPAGPFKGPHIHDWADNRHFATKATLPERLENARLLDGNLLTFENVFRWFCGKYAIATHTFDLPVLPKSDRLL